jgi:hypothetical protein
MNKTIYLPDDEAETWEKARRLANDRLSPVVLRALKEYIMTKEAEAAEVAGFERIDLEFEDSDDNDLPKWKAFRGKWIFTPSDPLRLWSDVDRTKGRSCAVAITAKGSVVVYTWQHREDYDPDAGEFESTFGYKFLVFPSLQEAALHRDVNYAIRAAVKKRGVPVEELDI